MEFDQGMRKALKRDTERIYNARIQNNVNTKGEGKCCVGQCFSQCCPWNIYKELSGVFCENTDL